MRLTISKDAQGDGPDAAHLLFSKLIDIQFTVTNDSVFIGAGLILKDVGYHDRETIYLTFVNFDGSFEPEYHILLTPENEYGTDLDLEYC